MAGIPDLAKKPFYLRNWFSESLTAVGVLISSGSAVALAISIIRYPTDQTRPAETILSWFAVGGAVIAVGGAITKIIQALHKDERDKDEERMDGLYAALHIAHSMVRHSHNFPLKDHDRLRVTLHRIVPPTKTGQAATEYQQMFNYIGGSGGQGRCFPIGTGIVGKAIREEEVLTFSRNNDDTQAYINELVKNYGFSRANAKNVTFDRNSWMAVPIKYDGKEVAGVLYLDAKDKDFFTDEVKEQVVRVSAGIAVFINERYK